MSAIVIVGAGLGGARVAENLREDGHDGPVVLIGKEEHPPYDRPPLSKGVLTGDDDGTDLLPVEFWADHDVQLLTGTEVTRIEPETRTVEFRGLSDGTTGRISDYKAVVLATGLEPRTLPTGAGLPGIHVLRTVDESRNLRQGCVDARTAVVVGAGFIGCEVAASLKGLGLDVTLVEPADAPLAASLGTTVGNLISRLHTGRGITVRTGVGVTGFTGDDRVRGVVLSGGTELPADIVVVGIGSSPTVDYLEGSGITLADRTVGGGIACDDSGRTTVPDVYALGDVANWRDADGTPSRHEHWNRVIEQAVIVSQAISGNHPETPRIPSVPYFWSDQFEIKVQALGDPSPTDDVHIVDDDGTKFLAYYSRGGTLTGVVGAGKAGAVMKMRAKLLKQTPIAELLG